MALLVTLVAAALPAPAAEPAAHPPTRCSPCAYSAGNRRHARRELAWARWYLRRHTATRPYRAWLARTRACESDSDYGTNTGNGYFGAYQFNLPTWRSVGGRGLPSSAPPLEQDYRAVVLLRRRGTSPWPVCG